MSDQRNDSDNGKASVTTAPPTTASDAAAKADAAPADSPASEGTAGQQRPASTAAPAQTIRGVQIKCLMNARYHAAREAFLDTVHRWFMFGVIAFGAGAVASVAMEITDLALLPSAFAAFAAILGALDLTFDLSNRARAHSLMKRRYFELLAEVESGERSVVEADARIHRCSAEEEPAYHALLIASWNAAQEMVYGDEAEKYEIPRTHRWLQNFRRFEGRQYQLLAVNENDASLSNA